jgi:hypothetical protein
MERMAAWGLTRETVRRWKLGWNLADDFRPVTGWGLPHAMGGKGKEAKVWLPPGLVVPFFRQGRLQSIKVRRTKDSMAAGPEHLRDTPYWEVRGSQTRFFAFTDDESSTPDVVVVVETERDGALIWQETRGLALNVWGMGSGGAGKRPDIWAHYMLSRAQLVLVALDTDEAGMINWPWWERQYPHSLRLIVPKRYGKDAGDLPGKLPVADWIRAGLPSHVRLLEERLSGARALGAEAGDDEGQFSPAELGEASPATQVSSPEALASRSTLSEPEGLAGLRALLGQCGRVYAMCSGEGIGAGGCEGCPRLGCGLKVEIGAYVWEHEDVGNWIEQARGGVLRGE